MSRLWIMRHGEAIAGTPDRARELTAHGEAQVAAMVERLAGGRRKPTRLIASPYVRAQQTAAIMARELGLEIETHEGISPEGQPREVAEWLLKQTGELLVVSHMPLVAMLTGLLVEGREDQGRPFPTAGLAELDAEVWAGGCAQLINFSAP